MKIIDQDEVILVLIEKGVLAETAVIPIPVTERHILTAVIEKALEAEIIQKEATVV